jgi:hypothetical protein
VIEETPTAQRFRLAGWPAYVNVAVMLTGAIVVTIIDTDSLTG